MSLELGKSFSMVTPISHQMESLQLRENDLQYQEIGMEETVILNVGGTRFQTFKSTLLRHRNTFFGNFFSQNYYDYMTPQGEYFFDRNPTYFSLILEYYRTGTLFVPSTISFGPLWKEIMYFGLDRVITRSNIDMEHVEETRYPNSWATHLACRFLPILHRAIDIKLLQFSIVIDSKGNHKGVPSLLQHPSDFKFWDLFCTSFAQAPPGSKDDFSNQFLSCFNVLINPQIPRRTSSTTTPASLISVQVDSQKENTNISYVVFRIKNIRVSSKQLSFVDRRQDSKESKVELMFLDGWQLDFCLPTTLTASTINQDSELFLIN